MKLIQVNNTYINPQYISIIEPVKPYPPSYDGYYTDGHEFQIKMVNGEVINFYFTSKEKAIAAQKQILQDVDNYFSFNGVYKNHFTTRPK